MEGELLNLSIFDAARDQPTATALVLEERAYTFADLANLVRVRSRVELPVHRSEIPGPECPPLAVLCSYGIETFVTLLTAVETGSPVLLLDPRSSPEERRRLLQMCGAVAPFEGGGRSLEPAPSDSCDDRNCLAVIATSGSSGEAKAAVLSRRAFIAAAKASAENLGWNDDDRWLLSLPLAHIGGFSVVIRCLMARKCVVWKRPRRFAAKEFAATVERELVTLVSLVPTMLERILNLPEETSLGSVRAMLVGGADCPHRLLSRAAARGWPLLTTYGSTETCSQVATQRPGTRNLGDLGCGPPLPGISVRIRSDQIEVSGPNMFTAYVGGPLISPRAWFRCGDRGRFDSHGNLHVLGRADSVIVSGGELISPNEVEHVVGEVAGVEWVSAYGVADREWGAVVVIAIAIAPGRDAGSVLKSVGVACSERLAGYKRPKRCVVVEANARPLLPNGKLDRGALTQLPTVAFDRV